MNNLALFLACAVALAAFTPALLNPSIPRQIRKPTRIEIQKVIHSYIQASPIKSSGSGSNLAPKTINEIITDINTLVEDLEEAIAAGASAAVEILLDQFVELVASWIGLSPDDVIIQVIEHQIADYSDELQQQILDALHNLLSPIATIVPPTSHVQEKDAAGLILHFINMIQDLEQAIASGAANTVEYLLDQLVEIMAALIGLDDDFVQVIEALIAKYSDELQQQILDALADLLGVPTGAPSEHPGEELLHDLALLLHDLEEAVANGAASAVESIMDAIIDIIGALIGLDPAYIDMIEDLIHDYSDQVQEMIMNILAGIFGPGATDAPQILKRLF